MNFLNGVAKYFAISQRYLQDLRLCAFVVYADSVAVVDYAVVVV